MADQWDGLGITWVDPNQGVAVAPDDPWANLGIRWTQPPEPPQQLPEPVPGQPVGIPQETIDRFRQEVMAMPENAPEKAQAVQTLGEAQQQTSQLSSDVAQAEAQGKTYAQQLASQTPTMAGIEAYGGTGYVGEVAKGGLMGLVDIGNTIRHAGMRSVFYDAQPDRENRAENFVSQIVAADDKNAGGNAIRDLARTMVKVSALHNLSLPVITGFTIESYDKSLTAAKDQGLSDPKAKAYAMGTAAIQAVVMSAAGAVGQKAGLLPREQMLSPALAAAAKNVFTKSGAEAALKNIAFQSGEGATIQLSQNFLDKFMGMRDNALEPEQLLSDVAGAAGDWALFGITATAGEQLASALKRTGRLLPAALKRAQKSELTLADRVRRNLPITKEVLKSVGIESEGTTAQERRTRAAEYIRGMERVRATAEQESRIEAEQAQQRLAIADQGLEMPSNQAVPPPADDRNQIRSPQDYLPGSVSTEIVGPETVATTPDIPPGTESGPYPSETTLAGREGTLGRGRQEIIQSPTGEVSDIAGYPIQAEQLDTGQPSRAEFQYGPEPILTKEQYDATQTRNQQQNNQPEYQEGNPGRNATEAGGGRGSVEGGQVQEEKSQEVTPLGGRPPKQSLVPPEQPAAEPSSPSSKRPAVRESISLDSIPETMTMVATAPPWQGGGKSRRNAREVISELQATVAGEDEAQRRWARQELRRVVPGLKKDIENLPPQLSWQDLEKQVQDAALNPDEANGILTIYGSIAESLGITPDEFAGNLAGVSKANLSESAYLKRKDSGEAYAQPAYHGSPHEFTKFTTDHIGSGEGSQAYGWGLYFAQNKDVAKYYKELAKHQGIVLDGELKDWKEVENMLGRQLGTDAAFKFRWDIQYNHETPEYAAENTIRRSKLTGDRADYLRAVAAGLERYQPSPTPRLSAQPRGGSKRALNSMSAAERLAFYDINSRLYWLNYETPDAALAKVREQLQKTRDVQQDYLDKHGPDYKKGEYDSPRRIVEEMDTALNVLDKYGVKAGVDKAPGKMYHVDLAPEDSELLHWDKPKEEQPQRVLDAVGAAGLSWGDGVTGEDFYRQLEHARAIQGGRSGADKRASQQLLAAGIRGIKFLDRGSREKGEGTSNFVIFDGADVAIQEVLGQKDRTLRGEFVPLADGRALIRVFREAQNLSSLAHESAHLLRRLLAQYRPDLHSDAERALGVKGKWTEHHEERFARQFERYLRDGKAPTNKLKAVFAQFRDWLRTIYKNLSKTKLAEEVHPELRKVFDASLGGETAFDFGENIREYKYDADGLLTVTGGEEQSPPTGREKRYAKTTLAGLKKVLDPTGQPLFTKEDLTYLRGLHPRELKDHIESAKKAAEEENAGIRSLRSELRSLIGSTDLVRTSINKKTGKKTVRKVSLTNEVRNIARQIESAGGDPTNLPLDLSEKTQQLRDGTYPALAAEASSLGQGDLENGLWQILQGGVEQWKLKKWTDTLSDSLAQHYEQQERAKAEAEAVVTGPSDNVGANISGDAPGPSGEGSNLPSSPPEQAAGFQLERQPASQPAPQQFVSTPTKQQDVVPDLWRGSLPGQQGLFEEPLASAAPTGPGSLEFPTGVKNAISERDRPELEMGPRPPVLSRPDEELVSAAKAAFSANPNVGHELVALIEAHPNKRITDTQQVILSLHKANLINEQNSLSRQWSDAKEAGDDQLAAEIDDRIFSLRDQLQAYTLSAEKAGSPVARSLRARQLTFDANLSLAEMERLKRHAVGGRPLTPEELQQIRELYAKIESLQAEISRLKAQQAPTIEEGKQKVFDDSFKKLKAKSKAEKKSDFTPDSVSLDEDATTQEIAFTAKELSKYFIREHGITEREANVDAVHNVLEKFLKGFTREDTMDAMSDYGTVRLLNKDSTETRYRQIRGEIQQVRKLIDMLAGKPPKITGTEKESPTDEKRWLTKLVNEYKRRGKFVITDPAKQAASALESVKTRLRNQITDLTKQIADRKKIIKTPTDFDRTDRGYVELLAKRDALKEQFDEIFGRPTMSDAKRIELATKAVEKSIAELDRRISTGDFSSAHRTAPTDLNLDALRAVRDSMRSQYEELRALDPQRQETDLRRAALAYERRLQQRAERLMNRIVLKDYGKTPPRPKMHGPPTEHLAALQEQLAERVAPLQEQVDSLTNQFHSDLLNGQRLRRETESAQAKADWLARGHMQNPIFNVREKKEPFRYDDETVRAIELNKMLTRAVEEKEKQLARSATGKVLHKAWESMGLIRALQTTGEVSPFLGKQGNKAFAQAIGELFTGDTTGAETVRDVFTAMLKSFVSEAAARKSWDNIQRSKSYRDYIDAKLPLRSPESHILGGDEIFIAPWVERIPGIRNFSRATNTLLNEWRTRNFDALRLPFGENISKEQAKLIGNYVKVATGYGDLGKLEEGASVLAQVLYSPRNLWAQIQWAVGQPLYKAVAAKEKEVAKIILKKYIQTGIGYMAIYSLFALAADRLGVNPWSTQFGKATFGNTHTDPAAGLGSIATLAMRIATQKKITSQGKKENTDTWEELVRFMRFKLSPTAALAIDIPRGKDAVGNELTASNLAGRFFPMTWSDINDVFREQGVPRNVGLSVLSFLGIPMSTYKVNPPKRSSSSSRKSSY